MRRFLKRLLYLGIGLTVLILAFYAEEDWRGKRDWEKYKAEWEAKGERFDLAALTPSSVPDDQNFVKAPIIASIYAGTIDGNGKSIRPPNTNIVNRLYLNIYGYRPAQKDPSPYTKIIWYSDRQAETKSYWPTIGNWQVSEMTDLHDWQLYFHSPKEFIETQKAVEARRLTSESRGLTTNRGPRPQWPVPSGVWVPEVVLPEDSFLMPALSQSPPLDVLVGLSKFDSLVAELRVAAKLPYSRFPLSYYTWNVGPHAPAFGTLKFPGEILVLRSVAELACEHSSEAFDDVNLILRLAELIPNQSFLHPQENHQILLRFALQPIWEGLATRRWSDDQLATFDRELVRLDLASNYQTVMRASRNLACAEIDYLPTLFKETMANTNDEFDAPFETFYYRAIPGGWFSQNKIRLCEAYTELFALWYVQNGTVSKKLINGRLLPGERPSYRPSALDSQNPYNEFASGYLYAAWEVAPFVFTQGSVNLARVACALERYYLRYHSYPATLQALVPEFINPLPHDLIDGKPLKYRQTPDGRFVLYSIDWTGKDKGGKVKENDLHEISGDWVWRYP